MPFARLDAVPPQGGPYVILCRLMTAVLFDLDGTLVDSRAAFARSVNHALRRNGLPERPEHELHRYLGPPLHATFRTLGGADRADALVHSYRERYRACAADESTVFEGMIDVLDALAAAGRRLLVVTSKPQALAQPLLTALGLAERFEAIVGPSLHATAEAKATTLTRALPRVDGVATMVGDRMYDVEAGHAHGLFTVGVTWGLGPRDELVEAGAGAIVDTPGELLAVLRQTAQPSPRRTVS